MRIVVTGSSGFIGSHLAAAATASNEVLGIDIISPRAERLSFDFNRCDIRDEAALTKVFADFKPDVVLHLAARTDLDGKTIDDYSGNTRGMEALLSSISKVSSVRRAIYTSSQLVCPPGYQPASEEDFKPENPYGASKVEGERIVRRNNGGGCEWCIVRPTTIWGPGMGPHYQTFLSLLEQGRYFHIGGSLLHKSYGYVGNTVFQYLKLAEAPARSINGKLFYLADYEPLSLRQWAEQLRGELQAPHIPTMPIAIARLVAALCDMLKFIGYKNPPLTSFRLRNMLTEYCVDLRATEEVCGALPYTVAQGVAATIDWYRSYVIRHQSDN